MVEIVVDQAFKTSLETWTPEFIRDTFKVLKSVIGDMAKLELTSEGIKCRQLESSRISMVDLFMAAEGFDEYRCEGPRRVALNLNEALKLVFKRSVKGAKLRVAFEEERALFELRDDIRRRKYIKLGEPLEEEVHLPRLFYKAEVRMKVSALKRIIDDFQASDNVGIEVYEDKIIFSAYNDDCLEETPLLSSNDNILYLQVEEPTKAAFSLEALRPFLKAVEALTETVKISMNTDKPMKIEAELPCPEDRLTYWQAPVRGYFEHKPEGSEPSAH